MKIVFMGTPDFAVPCLRALVKSGEEVKAVFTQPDKPKGRGYKMIPTPVKAAAQEYGIDVYQPVSLKKGDDAAACLELLKELSPDLIVVVAYGKILPKEILDIPQYGCINVHASLLPAYRGAAPIQWCILNGEKQTGVTTMYMEEGLDTGDMLISSTLQIGENETSSELHDRLSELGGTVLISTLEQLKNGTLTRTKQDDSKSCYASMITKDMSAIDFTKDAYTIHNVIRAITGFSYIEGKRLKMFRSEMTDKTSALAPGTIADSENFMVVCGDGKMLRITEMQAEGSKRMKAADFLRGNKIKNGMVLEINN
ncbi:MAG: methionyl-tRNA formyltransferase [Oscillospiraceae bacterium]|nr:methionyl-tRNA formyltransferase [Oscillospiraceae bacterium]